MSKELATKKDIIKSIATKSEFTEEQLNQYYEFFIERMVRLMNDPDTLSIRISKYIGDMYLRVNAARLSFYARKERGLEIPELSKTNYDKLDKYIEAMKKRHIYLYFKKNYLRSKFATDGLSIEELEAKQNRVYEKRKNRSNN